MNRDKAIKYFMEVAEVVKKQSTCLRNQVGCVLTNEFDRLISTGYNGSPAGLPSCSHKDCGPDITPCRAVHAEQNAILWCPENPRTYKKAYLTLSPCYSCMKLLVAFGVREIYYKELYREHEKEFALAREACVFLTQIN